MSPTNQKGIDPTLTQAAKIASPAVVLPVALSINSADGQSSTPFQLPIEQSLDSYRLPETPAPKGKLPGLSLINTRLLTFVVLPLVVAGAAVLAFSLLTGQDSNQQVTGKADKLLLETLSNPGDDFQSSVLHINLDTIVEADKFIIQDAAGNDLLVTDTANSRIGIGGFPEGEAKLQVAGDIMASGTLLANGGSTMLSDDGLRIGSVLVCTAAGCIAAPSTTPVGSSTTGTVTIISPERPLDADTLQGNNAAFFLNASNLSSGTLDDGRLSVNITKAGNSFNGPLQLVMTNVSGELPAISGINLTNVNADTLGGNNSSYYTNASNLSSGTVGDSRLSGNVALRNAFNTFQVASNSTTSFQIQNAGGTSTIFRADTTNDKIFANHLDLSGPGNNVVVLTLPSAAGSTTIRGAAAGDFFGTYISGNIKVDGDIGTSIIRPNQASDVGLTIRGRALQSGNLLNLRDNNNTVLASVSGTGSALFQAATNSTSAFQIQNAAGTSNLFIADTTNSRVGIGAPPANGLFTIGTNTTSASGGIYFGTDTNIYRSSAGALKTDGSLESVGALFVGGQATVTRAASGNIAYATQVMGDTQKRLSITANGDLSWGIGSSPEDTNLYRSAADTLRTDDNFVIQTTTNSTTAFQIQNSTGTSNLFIADTTNSRVGIGIAAPIQKLDVGGNLVVQNNSVLGGKNSAGTGYQWYMGAGGATNTVTLYTGDLGSSNQVITALNTQVAIGSGPAANSVLTVGTNTTAASGGITFGTDTNLYRAAANTLRTDDELVVSGNPLTINNGFLQGIRANGTDDFLKVQLGVEGFYRFQANASGSLLWGSGAAVGDTNLYRSAANTLKTDDNFLIQTTTNSTTAFQIQTATAADTLFVADTTTRSASGGNLIKIGNSTGTDGNTTILVVDHATANPSSNLAALSGGLFYNSTSNKMSIIENGVVKVLCNQTDASCGGNSTTLQQAYDASTGGSTSEIVLGATQGGIDLQDRSTDNGGSLGGNLLTVRATAATNATAGSALFNVNSTGQVALQNSSNSTAAFTIQNSAGTSNLFVADTSNTRLGVGTAAPTQLVHLASSLTDNRNTAVRLQTGTNSTNQSVGPTYPTNSSSDIGNGGETSWSVPSNANADDGAYALAQIDVFNGISSDNTEYLKSKGFGFSIPANAIIHGIKAEIERTTSGTQENEMEVQLVKNDVVTGANYARPEFIHLTSATQTYGGYTDLWQTTWTAADINNANFGLVYSAQTSGAINVDISVDFIRLTIYYSLGTDWTLGSDMSGSGNFKISGASSLGTNDNLSISAHTGAITLKNGLNSTSAFSVQNQAGSTLFGIDTVNSTIFSSSNLGFTFTSSSVSGVGDKLLKVQNNGSDRFYIDGTGNVFATGDYLVASGKDVGLQGIGNTRNALTKRFTCTVLTAAGYVVVIDTANAGQVTTTTTANSALVAGVITTGAVAGQTCVVAIGGVVQVTATTAAVSIGDRLVTSTTAGQVQTNNAPAVGTVIGKALSSKTAGSSGSIWVLISP